MKTIWDESQYISKDLHDVIQDHLYQGRDIRAIAMAITEVAADYAHDYERAVGGAKARHFDFDPPPKADSATGS